MTPERETILATPFAMLWYHPVERVVHHHLRKYTFGPALRELVLAGTEVLVAHGATKWLSDNRNGGPISAEDRGWAEAHFTPLLVHGRLRTWAVVPPEGVVGQMSQRRIVQARRTLGLDVRMFPSSQDALAWIVAR